MDFKPPSTDFGERAAVNCSYAVGTDNRQWRQTSSRLKAAFVLR